MTWLGDVLLSSSSVYEHACTKAPQSQGLPEKPSVAASPQEHSHIFSFVYTCCTAVSQSYTCPDNLSPGSKPVPTPQKSSSPKRQAVAHTDTCWIWFCMYWFVYQQMAKFIWNALASKLSVGWSHNPGKATGQIPEGVSEGVTSGRERGLSSVAESQGLLHNRP